LRFFIAIDRAVNRHLEDSLLLEFAPPPVLEETLLAQTGLHGNLLATSTKPLLQALQRRFHSRNCKGTLLEQIVVKEAFIKALIHI
jgi:hypothetical protein